MAKTPMKVYTLAEVKDHVIGEIGTPERDKYEYRLSMRRMGRMIKAARQKQNITQKKLGELVGVQKAQISKLEKGTHSATIDTLLKVFKALKAEVNFNIKIGNDYLRLQ